jgi:hypothetical protein
MYSYVATGVVVGFGGEFVRLKPPWSQLEISRWCPPCSPEATSKLKAQVETKFHRY